VEIGVILFPPLGRAAETSRTVEGSARQHAVPRREPGAGSQGQLMLAARRSKLQLGQITNSITRAAAVNATAALSLQAARARRWRRPREFLSACASAN
jgi:hypothetical protein